MICPECREAGGLNLLANRAVSARERVTLLAIAMDLHRECGNRCACQHMTGDWRNRRSDG